MKSFIVIILLFLIGSTQVLAQELVFEGQLKDFDTGKRMGGVTVSAHVNGTEVFKTSTGSNGKYSVKLPINKRYMIRYSMPGYVTKVMKVDANQIDEEDFPIGGRVMPPVDIELFAERPNANFSFMEKEPVVEWSWDSRKMTMNWDRNIYERMKTKIDNMLDQADRERKENEAKFNTLIQDADNLFAKEDFEKALSKYEEAIKIPGKALENHPNMRILEIEDLLQAQRKADLLAQQADQKYQNLIEAAENLKKNNDYEKAIKKFYEASDEKPNEQYPKDQIKEIEQTITQLEKKNEYDDLISKADQIYDQGDLIKAKDKYERASLMFPNEQHPKTRINEIEKKLKEEAAAKEHEKKYNGIIEVADKLFDSEKYKESIVKYKQALEYDKDATYPKERIQQAETKIEELNAEKDKQLKYQNLVDKGDNALNASKLEEAITAYNKALDILDEQYARDQKKKAEDLIAEQEKKNAEKQKIEELLTSGQKKLDDKKWQDAINDFNAVLAIENENSEAIKGKQKAEDALQKADSEKEKQTKFDNLVTQGDQKFKAEKWNEALSNYTDANNIIPNDAHVTAQLKKIEEEKAKIKEQEALNAQLNALFDQADLLELANNWGDAINKYDEILTIDPENSKAKEKQQKAKKLKSKQEEFNALKQEGLKLFREEKWEESKKKYKEALQLNEDEGIHGNLEIIENKLVRMASEKEKEEKYNALVKEGDALFDKDQLKNALGKFKEALSYKENDAYAMNRIKEINQAIAKNAEINQKEEAYNEAMREGNQSLDNNQFDAAIASFDKALTLKNNDDKAISQKKKAQELKEKRTNFDKYKNEGDLLFEQKKWEDAKTNYEKALTFDSSIQVNEQLKKIAEELAKLSSKEENKAKYNSLIEEGKKLEKEDQLENAIDKFKEALNYKEGDAFATNKITELEKRLKDQSKKEEAEKGYAEAMKRGESAMVSEDYAKAIEAYDDALEFIKNNQKAIEEKEKAKKLLKELSKDEEAYQKLLADGKAKRNEDKLLEAKKVYQEAQNIRPKDPIPQNAIVEIDELLRQKEEQKDDELGKIQQQYQEKITAADKAASNEEYENAIALYGDASRIKEDESYPREQIQKYQDILNEKFSEAEKNKEYDKIIKTADEVFNKEFFKESITFYEKALEKKPNETYPSQQIEKARIAMEEKEKMENLQTEYDQSIAKADKAFNEDRFEAALGYYKDALKALPDDKYAQDRRDETQQLLNDLTKKEQEQDQLKKQFNAIIDQADQNFNNKKYLDARDKYEEALKLIGDNKYALKRRDESVALAEQVARQGDDERYQKVIDKADEYFFNDDYEKALELYNRAIGLRSNDPYPKSQIDEINKLMHNTPIVEVGLDYLGDPQEISIMDGAALLEKAETKRTQLKTQNVLNRVNANNENHERLKEQDKINRHEYQNEITRIRNLRAVELQEHLETRRQTNINLDDEMFSITLQRIQENKYEKGSILRQNQNLMLIADEYRMLHQENSKHHLINADKIDDILKDHAELLINSNKKANQKYLDNHKKIIVAADDLRADSERAVVLRKSNEDKIRSINIDQTERNVARSSENYDKIQGVQAFLLEEALKNENLTADKKLIQLQIEKDITEMKNNISDQNRSERQKVHAEALEMDAKILLSHNQFNEAVLTRDQEKKERIQKNVDDLLAIKIMNELKKEEMVESHTQLRAELDRQEDFLSYKARLAAEKNEKERRENVDKIDEITIATSEIHTEKRAIPKENSEKMKIMASSFDEIERLRSKDFRNRKLKTQEMLDGLEENTIRFTEVIANSLGEDFPEGVTQESFVRKDRDGLPIRVITRRIVVKQGRGDVFIRIQTRNGITYSKNGEAITETSWINSTENANLARHY